MIIHLTSGTQELEAGATGVELSRKLKKELNGPALVMEVNGNLQDLKTPLTDGDKVTVFDFDSETGKEVFWHSSAHLLAQAVQNLFPDSQATIGPAIEIGFYYDFANLQLSEEDLVKIEEEAIRLSKNRDEPKRIEFAKKEDALAQFGDNPFKKEMIDNLDEGLSAYSQGEFIDLCRGPHIPHMGLIQGFKVMKTSGAYWRANAENAQLTRIYAVAYPDKKLLKAYLNFLEEAQKRDHRVLGKKLNLFSFHPEGPGMPFFHPNGMIVWDELMAFWEECHKEAGYDKIKTPIMLSQELWEKSGHWQNYRENMYISEIDDKSFAIKPMNCPGGMLYFKEDQYSYRQLPLRVAEIGNVHRHEMSGALSGLFRVRSFHQDDAHIFMKPEDIPSEIQGVLALADKMYSLFGLEYHLELSTKPEKAIGTDEQWEIATNGLKTALDEGGYEYVINEGDGAFYGPKIDMHIRDAIGRTWQCGTIQLDMMLPERFDLSYITADSNKERPVMIHRVVYGSIERFFGILIEHYAGKLPLWLAPSQVKVLTVTEDHDEWALEVVKAFNDAGLRASSDLANESINKKVRNAQLEQANYILVVGGREVEEKTVTVRTGNKVTGAYPLAQVVESLKTEYKTRADRMDAIA